MERALEPPPRRIVVLGVGSPLCSDDGVGGAIIDELERRHPRSSDAEWIDAGTSSFSLLGLLEAREGLIVVDASRMGQAPGSVDVFEGERMDGFLSRACRSSAHELGISELLTAAALTIGLPARRALVGVQPESVSVGMALSPAVLAAIPSACSAVLGLIERWGRV